MSWLAILSAVPWGTVIDKAPAVVEGAGKLIGSVRHSRGALVELAGHDSAATLAADVAALEEAVLTLNAQIAEAGRLIEDVAEANRVTMAVVTQQRGWIASLAVATVAAWLAVLYLLTR